MGPCLWFGWTCVILVMVSTLWAATGATHGSKSLICINSFYLHSESNEALP
jgi:hypothetical protein